MGMEMEVNRSKAMGHKGRADTLMLILFNLVTLALCDIQRAPSMIRVLSTQHVGNLKFPLFAEFSIMISCPIGQQST
jgi:hypothetical protein